MVFQAVSSVTASWFSVVMADGGVAVASVGSGHGAEEAAASRAEGVDEAEEAPSQCRRSCTFMDLLGVCVDRAWGAPRARALQRA